MKKRLALFLSILAFVALGSIYIVLALDAKKHSSPQYKEQELIDNTVRGLVNGELRLYEGSVSGSRYVTMSIHPDFESIVVFAKEVPKFVNVPYPYLNNPTREQWLKIQKNISPQEKLLIISRGISRESMLSEFHLE